MNTVFPYIGLINFWVGNKKRLVNIKLTYCRNLALTSYKQIPPSSRFSTNLLQLLLADPFPEASQRSLVNPYENPKKTREMCKGRLQRDANHVCEWVGLWGTRIMDEGNAIQMTAARSLSQAVTPLLPLPFAGLDPQPTGTLWCMWPSWCSHTPKHRG